MRFYAIGDIHGQRDMLRAAHQRIARDRDFHDDEHAPVIHLGDLTDRGPDSAGVIDDLLAGLQGGQPWLFVRGNHDQLFLDFCDMASLDDPRADVGRYWTQENLGGSQTLRSYGIEPDDHAHIFDANRAALQAIPASHIQFLRDLPLYHELDDAICVHAGIRPGIPLAQQTPEDLTWIRAEFLEDTRDHGKLILHGHTPVSEPTHYGNRINIDTGAGYGRPMSVVVMEGRDSWVVTDTGRAPLRF